jgi:type IVB pilus formation R64 PilN family outer membrane protein
MKAGHLFRIAAAAALLLCLASCETLQHSDATEAFVDKRADFIDHKINDAANAARPDGDVVKYIDHQYVSMQPVETDVHPSGPDSKILNCNIQIATDQAISLLEAAQIVSHTCGVPVRVTKDALEQISSAGNTGAAAPSGAGAAQVVGPVFGPLGANAVGQPGRQGAFGAADNSLIDVNYDGDADGFLNMLTAREGGLSWQKDDSTGGVRIYAADTETYAIASIASTKTLMDSNFQSGTTMVNGTSTSGSGGGSSGGGSGGSGSGSGQGTNTTMQSSVLETQTNFWDELKTTLEMMAGKGHAAVSPSVSAATVHADVDTLYSVKHYIDYQNKRLGKFVQFNVRVFSVTLSNTDSAGVNWTALYQTLAGKYGFALTGTPFTAPAAAVSAGFSIIKGSSSPWGGTQAVLSALNEQGKAHLEREQALPTLNFQAVATQVGTQQGYVAGTQTTQTAQVGSSTSIQMGTINVGFNLSLFPYVEDNNDILVQFNLNLSNLDSIRTVTVGGSSAEAPNINLPLNTVQKVRVRPGDTLVLTGINQNDDRTDRTGTGMHWNWLIGGGLNATSTKTELIVLITPVLMD